MNLLPGWHPLAVHFPLALVLCASLLLWAARVVRREELAATLATVGTWNLCLGAAAALLALATGLGAVLDLEVSDAAHRAISSHMKWALFTSLALMLLAVWRGAGVASASRPSWLFILLLTANSAALMVTGFKGGENVYRYAVGVERGDARP
jgi:uncharacterized membrane protein